MLPSALVYIFGLISSHLPAKLLLQSIPGAISPLAPDFVQGCHDLIPTPPGTHTSRLVRLASTLNSRAAARNGAKSNGTIWIAEPGPSVFYYLGGFSTDDWFLSERPLLIAIDQHASVTILTPRFEELRATLLHLPREMEGRVKFVAWDESDSPYEVLADKIGTGQVVLDGHVREFIGQGLREAGWRAAGKEVREKVELIRERKEKREIDLLRCANQMTLQAIRSTRSQMHIGITESATRKILQAEMAELGLKDGDGLVLFGENAALPHGKGTDRTLGKDDLALIDCGGTWGGYTSDITRTFSLPDSDIPRAHIDAWDLVRKAQSAPYHLLKSSNASSPPTLGELDAAARKVITTSMSRESDGTAAPSAKPDFSVFTHRLGHGIGLEGHEGPYLVQGPLGAKSAKPGYVFSLEPGIYLPADEGEVNGIKGVGVRLEDCFVITIYKEGGLGGEWLSGPVERWGDV